MELTKHGFPFFRNPSSWHLTFVPLFLFRAAAQLRVWQHNCCDTNTGFAQDFRQYKQVLSFMDMGTVTASCDGSDRRRFVENSELDRGDR